MRTERPLMMMKRKKGIKRSKGISKPFSPSMMSQIFSIIKLTT